MSARGTRSRRRGGEGSGSIDRRTDGGRERSVDAREREERALERDAQREISVRLLQRPVVRASVHAEDAVVVLPRARESRREDREEEHEHVPESEERHGWPARRAVRRGSRVAIAVTHFSTSQPITRADRSGGSFPNTRVTKYALDNLVLRVQRWWKETRAGRREAGDVCVAFVVDCMFTRSFVRSFAHAAASSASSTCALIRETSHHGSRAFASPSSNASRNHFSASFVFGVKPCRP